MPTSPTISSSNAAARQKALVLAVRNLIPDLQQVSREFSTRLLCHLNSTRPSPQPPPTQQETTTRTRRPRARTTTPVVVGAYTDDWYQTSGQGHGRANDDDSNWDQTSSSSSASGSESGSDPLWNDMDAATAELRRCAKLRNSALLEDVARKTSNRLVLLRDMTSQDTAAGEVLDENVALTMDLQRKTAELEVLSGPKQREQQGGGFELTREDGSDSASSSDETGATRKVFPRRRDQEADLKSTSAISDLTVREEEMEEGQRWSHIADVMIRRGLQE
ncbi:hypothetical protein C1H76_5927 [Elsinoe australis]|uniref:Uncharacterized protein n=1 Tax=Elsinoe australis TaxID=40998 RepID=A0A4U7AZK2_9PEZI|nr:hypothetical protein C1H76_5927 [Elsinoe australis]